MNDQWATLMEIPPEVHEVEDNQGRKWEREGCDWVTYGSFIQRLSTAVTDLSGWAPFVRLSGGGGKGLKP